MNPHAFVRFTGTVILACSTATLVACAQGSPSGIPTDPGTTTSGFSREVRGGRLHAHALEAMPDSEEAVFTAVASDLRGELATLSAADFVTQNHVSRASAGGAMLRYDVMRQQVAGIPIHGSYLNVIMRQADAAAPAKIVASSYRVFQSPDVDVVPAVGEGSAVSAAKTVIRKANAPVREAELEIWPVDGALRLVWNVTFRGSYERALVFANGPAQGRVKVLDERIYETNGTVNGFATVNGAPGGDGVATLTALEGLTVTAGTATATTDGAGAFTIDAAEDLSATLSGAAAVVVDQKGATLSVTSPADPTVDLVFATEASGEAELAQVNAYVYINAIRNFMLANGVSPDTLPAITANTNINDACNAFFSPAELSLNFFSSGEVFGTKCNNSAEETVIFHEFGHYVDNQFGGIIDGGLSEGWGDLIACFATKQPGTGIDLFVDTEGPLRTCDNDYQFPAGGNDEVHNLGQAWAGFAWHSREGLIAALGEDEGDALARSLFLPSFASNAPDIPSAVREVFIRDDDDGDLTNHTPHWDILIEAANRHALGFVVDGDLTAPAAITDLTVSEVTSTSATLTWTATGDDDAEGTASRYDIRALGEPITPENFALGSAIPGPVPTEAGTTQTLTIPLAPSTTTFVAMEAFDEQNNGSAISNVVEITTSEGTVVFDDGAENGLGEWVATGLWHVTETAAASGTKSFWYGQEATGNYDTGAANTGTLTSPVIDLAGIDNPVLAFDQLLDIESAATFDIATVRVFDVNDPTVEIVAAKEKGTTFGAFETRFVGLTGLGGRQVQIELSFNTVDNVANTTKGWLVDNVQIVGDGELPGSEGNLMINEVLTDPGSFDSNGDGKANARGDEFIELVNVGDGPVDLTGVVIEDRVRVRFAFPDGASLDAGQVAVVFGSGAPVLAGVETFSSNGLYLNNRGDDLTVRRADGEVLAVMSYGCCEGRHNQSLNREVDADPDSPFVLHTTLSDLVASPGTKADGSAFPGAEEPPEVSSLVINELLTDPAPDYDANGDGVFDYATDEFVELVNTGDAPVDLSGATLADGFTVRLVFPDGTVVAPGAALVVFGGGSPVGDFGGAMVLVAPELIQLNNDGDSVTIRNADGDTLATTSYDSLLGAQDQSLVREVEGDPDAAWVFHGSVGAGPASPGTHTDGTPFGGTPE
ncbi:MAG TPA: lamin tail domain-containing protein [Kofleriaceae bacterium]|nr:lamin tail domain-containing protein [Kofleriaceae bacterium]